MITELIIYIFLSIIEAVFTLIQLPLMPLEVTQSVSAIIEWFQIPLGVISNYVGNGFLSIIMVLIIAYAVTAPTVYIAIFIYQRIKS